MNVKDFKKRRRFDFITHGPVAVSIRPFSCKWPLNRTQVKGDDDDRFVVYCYPLPCFLECATLNR